MGQQKGWPQTDYHEGFCEKDGLIGFSEQRSDVGQTWREGHTARKGAANLLGLF